MDILRFITAGNIDDGKSTLTGRLLLDTQNIKADILDSISGADGNDINLAFITDGLRAERLAGITIDVAYKYFNTPRRKYIITDAPGHFQYTKNLVTGASGVDVMIILVDATIGISSQTRRHTLVASFLHIPNIVVAINKMDLVGYSQQVYDTIKNNYLAIAAQAGLQEMSFIPMSALNGDNVTIPSANMPWYAGQTLLQYLELAGPVSNAGLAAMRLPVQYVSNGNIYGRVVSGIIRKGDTVCIMPSGSEAVISKMIANYHEVYESIAGADICITLAEGISPQRGDVITATGEKPLCNQVFEAELCWLDDATPLALNKDYLLRIGTGQVFCQVTAIISKTNNETFAKFSGDGRVAVNEFARVRIKTKDKIAYDLFRNISETGRAILIDLATNNTSGALVIG